jgi:dTDP-glucose 4,6-dehydratase
MTIIVTGAAGFIGSNFVLDWFKHSDEMVLSFDLLTYAGNIDNLSSIGSDKKHIFIKGDIGDTNHFLRLLDGYQPRAIINFAAESHVDRSINNPYRFIQTNILGTYNLLECLKSYWGKLNFNDKNNFRFLHVSTDEVYGSLETHSPAFSESNQYLPSSPYSASKASADHLVRAWNQTYDLPVLTTNCSNNYGPYQFPEKLIPLCILNALSDKSIPIYGDGKQVRDWLYVKDHCAAIRAVLDFGNIGETYNIGGKSEKKNIDVVNLVCQILDELKPKSSGFSYKKQIMFVKDRPGHDRRYAIDSSKITQELNWSPKETFESGIYKTVKWYLSNKKWIEHFVNGK